MEMRVGRTAGFSAYVPCSASSVTNAVSFGLRGTRHPPDLRWVLPCAGTGLLTACLVRPPWADCYRFAAIPLRRSRQSRRSQNSVRSSSVADKTIAIHEVDRSRPAHWVIRTSDLHKSLDFFCKVFGMHILRHEEHEASCEIGCNGDYTGPWSKTMVGYGSEDEFYCLELTYTYGINSYPSGSGLRHIAIGVGSPELAFQAAASMGYAVESDVIVGPEDYNFLVLPLPADRKERFMHVALNIHDMSKAARFYKDVLGMRDLPSESSAARMLGFSAGEEVPLMLFDMPASPRVKLKSWEGRNAISMPNDSLQVAYQKARDGSFGRVLHPLRWSQELCKGPENSDAADGEELGNVQVAIVCDPEGQEVCLVGAEGYDPAVSGAYKPDMIIDWSWRERAIAGERTEIPKHMEACK